MISRPPAGKGVAGSAIPGLVAAGNPTSVELSLEDLRREPTVYLLPECENEEAARECLEEVCGQIFEEQLDGWYRVPGLWPNRRELTPSIAGSSGALIRWWSISATIRSSKRRSEPHGFILWPGLAAV
jgi:hypothetical protein